MTRLVAALRGSAVAWWKAPAWCGAASGLVIAVGAVLLFYPWTQIPFLVFGLAPTLGGYVRFCADIARGIRPKAAVLGHGFSTIDRWTGIMVMTYLHLILALLPLCFAFGLANLGPRDARWMWVMGGAVISAPLVVATALKLVFVPIVGVDAPHSESVDRIFERAAELVSRRRWLAGAVLLIGAAWITAGIHTYGGLLLIGAPAYLTALVILHDDLASRPTAP